ncbi:MAG: protein kinase [Elusimicrobiota bacterium]
MRKFWLLGLMLASGFGPAQAAPAMDSDLIDGVRALAIVRARIAQYESVNGALSAKQKKTLEDVFQNNILNPYLAKHEGKIAAQEVLGLCKTYEDFNAMHSKIREFLQDRVFTDKEHQELLPYRKAYVQDLAQLAPELEKGFRAAQQILNPRPPNSQPPSPGGGGQDDFSGKTWDELNAVLKTDSNNIAALRARAALNDAAGDMAAANADARRVLELDPNDKGAFAIYKLTEGRVDYKAADIQPQAPDKDPQDMPQADATQPAWLGLRATTDRNPALAMKAARGDMRVGDMDAAVLRLDRVLESDPSNVAALRLRALAQARSGRYAEALRDVEAGLALSPRDLVLLTTKAFVKNRMKDYRGAMEASALARELDPNSADALANYAHAVGGLGDRQQMLELLAAAGRMDSRYAPSLASAQTMPPGSDILFLFPGETLPGAAAQAEAPAAASAIRSSRGLRFGVLALLTLLGGVLLAVGLIHGLIMPMSRGVKTVITRLTRPGPVTEPAPEAATASSLPLPRDPDPSGLLRGQYRVMEQIGSGGMGVVYAGLDVSLNRKVAVKKMRDELRLDRHERVRFINEAKTVASLHHPNIVDIYAIIENGDDIYLVFEYVSGRTVYDLVKSRGGLGFKDALGVCRSMAAALDFSHSRNVIHRDLKPSNVMVTEEGFIKVMDFGIARMAKDAATRFSMTNTVAGTPPYMAPEQEQGAVRKESDVYALAVCAYEMLTGKMPFSGTGAGMLMNKVNMSYAPISTVAAGLPPGIDAVFSRAFQPDPDRRYHSPGELLTALEALPAPV